MLYEVERLKPEIQSSKTNQNATGLGFASFSVEFQWQVELNGKSKKRNNCTHHSTIDSISFSG